MRREYFHGLVTAAALVAGATMWSVSASAQQTQGGDPPAQGAAAPKLTQDQLLAYARAQVAIGLARDSMQVQYAATRNKTDQAQRLLQDKLRAQIEEILHHAGLTDAEFQRRAFVVSSEPELRKTFDSVIVVLTGAPLPGQVQANAQQAAGRGGRAGGTPVQVPPGPAGTHIGHVMNSFGDTPMMAGLLPTAMAEARIAAQHAELAARNTADLASMKTHAGHVIHALDPTVVTMGPGQGYGVKKAALGVASHIELAANAEGASASVKTHATHIATSSRNTVKRAEQIIALAKQIQEATTAPAAAALLSQVTSLTAQLIAGADGNGDGRITWEDGEGGLQIAEDHVGLMLRSEM